MVPRGSGEFIQLLRPFFQTGNHPSSLPPVVGAGPKGDCRHPPLYAPSNAPCMNERTISFQILLATLRFLRIFVGIRNVSGGR